MIDNIFYAITVFLSVAFFCTGFFLVLMNWWCVSAAIRGKKQSSWVPLLGGIFASLGMMLAGKPFSNWWFIPFIVDFGCFPGLLHCLVWWILHKRESIDSPH